MKWSKLPTLDGGKILPRNGWTPLEHQQFLPALSKRRDSADPLEDIVAQLMPHNGWLAEVPRERVNLQRVCWLDPY